MSDALENTSYCLHYLEIHHGLSMPFIVTKWHTFAEEFLYPIHTGQTKCKYDFTEQGFLAVTHILARVTNGKKSNVRDGVSSSNKFFFLFLHRLTMLLHRISYGHRPYILTTFSPCLVCRRVFKVIR